MGIIWAEFLTGFCQAEFLCTAGEPNWRGWILWFLGLLISGFLLLALFFAVAYGVGLAFMAAGNALYGTNRLTGWRDILFWLFLLGAALVMAAEAYIWVKGCH